MLREFEAARNGILGSSASDDMSDVLAIRQQAHYSLDDFSLALVRKYENLRPFIKMYNKCFTSVSEKSSRLFRGRALNSFILAKH